jgi:hypothetical protein
MSIRTTVTTWYSLHSQIFDKLGKMREHNVAFDTRSVSSFSLSGLGSLVERCLSIQYKEKEL